MITSLISISRVQQYYDLTILKEKQRYNNLKCLKIIWKTISWSHHWSHHRSAHHSAHPQMPGRWRSLEEIQMQVPLEAWRWASPARGGQGAGAAPSWGVQAVELALPGRRHCAEPAVPGRGQMRRDWLSAPWRGCLYRVTRGASGERRRWRRDRQRWRTAGGRRRWVSASGRQAFCGQGGRERAKSRAREGRNRGAGRNSNVGITGEGAMANGGDAAKMPTGIDGKQKGKATPGICLFGWILFFSHFFWF